MQPEATNAPRVVGRYKLYGEIGGGGMATVHVGRLAGSVGFGRTVAIKRMHRDYARDPDFVAMFVDEARVAARVQHPNVVQTLDVVSDQGELFLVMELVHGVALTRLFQAGAVAPRIACAIGAGILHGLHAAHEATDESGTALEIVHRDISPHNVLVGADGVARVLDFGIAKATGRQHATRDGMIKGKCAYMAPEQITNVRVNRQCDVFAASIVLWEMLTGERLFRAETERDTLARVMAAPIAPPSKHNPAISPELDAIVMRGLERELDARWATAREMARELERLPTAPPSEIGEWVGVVAEADLDARLALVASIERGSASLPDVGELRSGVRNSIATSPETPNAVAKEETTALSSSYSEPRLPGTKKRAALVWIAAGAALATIAGGGIALSRALTKSAPHETTAPQATVVKSAEVAPPAETIFELVDTPAPTDTTPLRVVTRSVTPRPLPSASASAKPAIDCSSPSYVGPDNRVHYRLECLKGAP